VNYIRRLVFLNTLDATGTAVGLIAFFSVLTILVVILQIVGVVKCLRTGEWDKYDIAYSDNTNLTIGCFIAAYARMETKGIVEYHLVKPLGPLRSGARAPVSPGGAPPKSQVPSGSDQGRGPSR